MEISLSLALCFLTLIAELCSLDNLVHIYVEIMIKLRSTFWKDILNELD